MTTRSIDTHHWLQPKSWSKGSHTARFDAIRPWIEGKSVLDIGAASGHGRDDWMHRAISEVASHAVGVDHDSSAVDEIRGKGVDSVVHGDARTIEMGMTFDVVHAGELIEHLDDFKSFLGAVRRHLKEGGTLILTTPNAFCVSNFVYRLGGTPRVNRDHMCWFCEDTLRQLLERSGYEIVHLDYVAHETPGKARAILSRGVRAVLPRRLKWNTLLAVARVNPAKPSPAS